MKILLKTLFLGSLSFGCGGFKTPVDEQPSGKVEIPEYTEENQGLNLTDENKSLTYNGMILFWTHNATATDVQFIVDAVNRNKSLEADVINLKQAPRYSQLASLIEKENENQKALKEEADKDRDARQNADLNNRIVEIRSKTSTWMETSLTDLLSRNVISEEIRNSAYEKFSQYCDAKIWEYAVTTAQISQNFMERPTPNMACESYYRSNNVNLLDVSTPLCSPSTLESGKNYFACFWIEGVMKTNYWKDRYLIDANTSNDANPSKIELLTASINDGTFQEFMTNETLFNFENAYAGGRRESIKLSNNELLKPDRTIPSGSVGTEGLQIWFSSFEKLTTRTNSVNLQFFAGLDETQELEYIRKFIQLLGYRVGDNKINVSDVIFNHSILKGTYNDPSGEVNSRRSNGTQDYSIIFGEVNPENLEISQEYKDLIAASDKKIVELQDEQKNLQLQVDKLVTEIDSIKVKSLKTIDASKTISDLLLTNVEFVLNSTDKGYEAIVDLNKSTSKMKLRACADTNGANVACEVKEGNYLPGKFVVNTKTGLMDFEIILDNLDDIGIPSLGNQSDVSFSRLEPKLIESKTLSLKLLSTKIKGLENITGDLKINLGDDENSIHGNAFFSQYNELNSKL